MPYEEAGDLLEVLRTARGLTQMQLAEKTGISQAALSKLEANTVPLDDERASTIAAALDVPVSLLGERIGDGARIYHRKRASLPITADKRIRATALMLQAQVSSLLGTSKPALTLTKRPLPMDHLYTPADRAREARADLGLGTGPIINLVSVLEAAGVLVVRDDLKTLQVDAIAVWPEGTSPVVFLSDQAPADRQRFTAAHELGHAVMHDIPSENQEREADEFAAEFLMPRKSILPELDDISFGHLVQLKAKWGVSIAALARRAVDLNKMTDRQFRNFNIHMASTGMNRVEPQPLAPEHPSLVGRFIRDQLDSGSSIDRLAQSAQMTRNSFTQQFALEMS